MEAINFFNAVNYLEPLCPGCNSKVKYGLTTKYDEKKKCHVCINCGTIV